MGFPASGRRVQVEFGKVDEGLVVDCGLGCIEVWKEDRDAAPQLTKMTEDCVADACALPQHDQQLLQAWSAGRGDAHRLIH